MISVLCISNANQISLRNKSTLVHSITMYMVRDFIGVMNEVMSETHDVFKVSSSRDLIWNFHKEYGNTKISNIISLKDFEYQVFEV